MPTPARSDRAAPVIDLRPGMAPDEIYRAYGLTCPPRVGTLRNPARRTYGRAVARVAYALGLPMMPWQRYVADVALELDPETDALAYRSVNLLTPRQSGKTTLLLAVTVHRMSEMGSEAAQRNPACSRQTALYTAQHLQDARLKMFDEHVPILNASPYRRQYTVRLSNGSECIRWHNGSRQGLVAGTETAGHGKVLDLGIHDEAFAATDNRLQQAFSPAMITRWSPQHWTVSTEGTETSTYLAELVSAGRDIVTSGEESTVCYLEWSNTDGDRTDPDTWLSCMPALCPTVRGKCSCDPAGIWHHTVRLPTIRGELDKMIRRPKEFDRAYLNRRGTRTPTVDPNVPTIEQWAALLDPTSAPGDRVVFAVDITPQRTFGSIVVVGARPDGLLHVGLIEHRPGTAWIVPRLVELRDRWDPAAIGLDAAGPAGSLLPELATHDITKPPTGTSDSGCWGSLVVPTAREVAQACGAYADMVRSGGLRQSGQPLMHDALALAATRPLGDAWAWARRTASGDISPLVGATVGVWAYGASARWTRALSYDPVANIR